ncbi:SDR family oxidoreductase [Nonomuraea sp. NPDC049504]|uniref:SDR family NAD(P)-dependent oxidoreductase n=1 Tax=Nonomuraea sp. NPDC049504 TaxID=3154729 RepID=UPI0034456489
MTSRHLENTVAIVTGAGSGIGRATAITLAKAGAHVLAVGRRPAPLEETATHHPGIAVHSADITADGAPQAVVKAATDRWGHLDVLVNNAGGTAMMPLAETDAARIASLLALNVTAPSLLAHAALPYLRKTRGTIINISSTYGHRPLPGAAHYAASKAAIEQLTRSWALELAADGIRVNAVAPGPTESEALTAAGLPEETVTQIKQDEAASIPLGRRGVPEEVATWILHLADPTTTWLTGQILAVDGGLNLT